jgi:hypothetical protein
MFVWSERVMFHWIPLSHPFLAISYHSQSNLLFVSPPMFVRQCMFYAVYFAKCSSSASILWNIGCWNDYLWGGMLSKLHISMHFCQ